METVRLTPSHMVAGGTALAREGSGRVVFVSGGLPGETVDVTLRTTRKDFATADVAEVIIASPDRVEPLCGAWHRGCGGCDWQHVAPGAQLLLKTEIVREALHRTGRIDAPVVFAGAAVPPWNYRTTVRLAGRSDGLVGFRSRRSHEVVPIDDCPVADHRINALLASGAIDGRAAVQHDVMVRVGAGNGPAVTHPVTADQTQSRPEATVHENVAGHRFRVSPGSFFQSSPQSAELLVAAVARACADVDITATRVIDAYGGVGLFAATVARSAEDVIVVEASPAACADARHNLVGRRATVVESRLEDWDPVPAGLVIADPARNGLDKAGAASVTGTGAAVIVLISCDPGSMARDSRLLQNCGYVHRSTEVLDLFPNTSHVEAVSRFDASPRSPGRGKRADHDE